MRLGFTNHEACKRVTVRRWRPHFVSVLVATVGGCVFRGLWRRWQWSWTQGLLKSSQKNLFVKTFCLQILERYRKHGCEQFLFLATGKQGREPCCQDAMCVIHTSSGTNYYFLKLLLVCVLSWQEREGFEDVNTRKYRLKSELLPEIKSIFIPVELNLPITTGLAFRLLCPLSKLPAWKNRSTLQEFWK